MKSMMLYGSLLIGCMAMLIACKQPSNNVEKKDLTFELEVAKLFTTPSQLESTVEISRGSDIVPPLYISPYDSDKMEASFNDDFTLLNVVAKSEGVEEIKLTDSNGISSSPVTIVIDQRDLTLAISPDQYELKMGKSHFFDITKGADINFDELTVSGDQYVSAKLIGEKIEVTANAVGSGRVTLNNSEGVSASLTVTVMPLHKKISITPSDSILRVGDAAIYTVSQEEDGGELIRSVVTDGSIMLIPQSSHSFNVMAVAPGTATLLFTDSTDSSITASKTITVREVDKYLNISPSRMLTLNGKMLRSTGTMPNQSITLIASGADIEEPFTAHDYDKDVISVKAVNSILTIKAVGRGSSTLTLMDANGVRSNSVTIDVLDILFVGESPSITVKVGESKNFTATIRGQDSDLFDSTLASYWTKGNLLVSNRTLGDAHADGTRLFSMDITGVTPTTHADTRYVFRSINKAGTDRNVNLTELYVKVIPAD